VPGVGADVWCTFRAAFKTRRPGIAALTSGSMKRGAAGVQGSRYNTYQLAPRPTMRRSVAHGAPFVTAADPRTTDRRPNARRGSGKLPASPDGTLAPGTPPAAHGADPGSRARAATASPTARRGLFRHSRSLTSCSRSSAAGGSCGSSVRSVVAGSPRWSFRADWTRAPCRPTRRVPSACTCRNSRWRWPEARSRPAGAPAPAPCGRSRRWACDGARRRPGGMVRVRTRQQRPCWLIRWWRLIGCALACHRRCGGS
jgi:hypothetical protein